MFSIRELVRTYLDYYRQGGVRYFMRNDVAILRAVENILRKQFETPQMLLSHIEAAFAQRIDELKQSLEWNRNVEQLKETLQQVEELRRQIDRLAGAPSRFDELADRQMRRNPELALLGHLAAYLESACAVDVGANSGEFTQGLLDAGYDVFAFEPYPPAHQKLAERFRDKRNVTTFGVAIGTTDGTAKLNLASKGPDAPQDEDPTRYNSLVVHSLPEGWKFSGVIDVEIRSLESLRRSAQIPGQIAVVKIDAEGAELHVIQGMGSLRPSVLVAEFWSAGHVLAGGEVFNSLPVLVNEMRGRSYKFHIAIYRLGSLDKSRFISNSLHAPEASWGNVFFFAEMLLFEKALHWCDVYL